MTTVRLYHYCCSCSARQITRRGFLRPYGRALFGQDLVWLTDQAVPDREGLGLTSNILSCDRLEHQYVVDVDAADVEPWLTSDIRRRLSLDLDFHEFEDGRAPETWWISTQHVLGIRNRSYQPPSSPCGTESMDQPASAPRASRP